MKGKIKKLFLQTELVDLELEETVELTNKFNKEFNEEFREETAFIISNKKQEKIEPTPQPDTKPPPPAVVQKIYRNLAKILHPDVSKIENAEDEFKKITEAYENHDLIKLIHFSIKYEIELPDLTEEEFKLVENKIIQKQKTVEAMKQTLAWYWGNTEEDKDVLREKIYTFLGIDKEEFERWKFNKLNVHQSHD